MADLTSKKLSQTIRAMRQASGLNQEAIAKLLGIDQAGVSRIENNQQPPTAEQIIKLTTHFGVSIESFFKDSVNLWDVAIKFDNLKWLPKKYTQYRQLRTREILPILSCLCKSAGPDKLKEILKAKKLHMLLQIESDELVSTNCLTDLIRMIENGEVPNCTMDDLKLAHTFAIKNALYTNNIFNEEDSPFTLFHKWIGMSDKFSGIFFFNLVEQQKNKAIVEWGLHKELDPIRLKVGRYRHFFRHFYLNLMASVPMIVNKDPFKGYILEDFKGSFGGKQIVSITQV